MNKKIVIKFEVNEDDVDNYITYKKNFCSNGDIAYEGVFEIIDDNGVKREICKSSYLLKKSYIDVNNSETDEHLTRNFALNEIKKQILKQIKKGQ